jgi:hypothetical protein
MSNGNIVPAIMLLDFNPKLIEARSSRNWTALHFAACGPRAEQCIEVSKLLLANGPISKPRIWKAELSPIGQ